MRSRAPWPQMAVALGVLSSVWGGLLLALVLSLVVSSAGSAYWRRHASGDVLFSDLLLWGWLRRRRTERRLGRADELLREAGNADSAGKAQFLRELGAALDDQDPYLDGHSRRVARYVTPPSHTADDCKHGGWRDLGYPNQGQCVADADKHRPKRSPR